MEVFGLGIKIKEEGAATVEASIKRLGAELAKTALTVGGLTAGLNKLVQETSAAQFAEAQLGAVIQSTGKVAGQTADALKTQASALQGVTTFGDDAIIKMQALLLTFTNVRGAVYTAAVPAILDMASALGQDLQSAAIQVGKALNDPILGVSALGRAGVQFSEQQKELIKTLVETGQRAEAQRVILKELETQFGGAAEAARNTFGGALAALNNAFGDLFELTTESTTGAVAVINKMTDALVSLNENMIAVKASATVLAGIVAGLFAPALVTAITGFAAGVSGAAMAHLAAAGAAGVHSTALTVFIGVATAAAGAVGRLMAAFGPVGLIAVGIGAIVAKITQLADETNAIYDEADRRGQEQLDKVLARRRERIQAQQDAEVAAIQAAKNQAEVIEQLRLQRFEEREAASLKRRIAEFKKYADEVRRIRADAEAEINRRIAPMVERAKSPIDAGTLQSEMNAISTDLAGMTVPLDEKLVAILRLENLHATFAENIRDGVSGGIRSGLEAALQTGDIGNFTKALAQSLTQSMSAAITDYIIGGLTEIWKSAGKQLIKGLMTMAAEFAQKSIVFASFMEKIKSFLSFGNGLGAILAATALLTFAQANGGKSSMGGNVISGGAGGLNVGMSGTSATLPIQQIIFGATSATTAAGMTPRQAMNVTIIGPNDPSAQRAMQELMTKADSRGRLG